MIIRGESIEAYHATENISKSKLMTYAKHGPAHYYRQYVKRDLPQPDKPAFAIGRAFDDLMCTSKPSWAVKPDGFDGRTAAGKQWVAEHAGHDTLTAVDDAMIYEMREAMSANAHASRLWTGCEAQVTLRRELPALGITAQARPDGIHWDHKAIVDIKTTRDMNGFSRDAINFGYHLQLALGQWLAAQDGHQLDAFLIVVEAKCAPRCKVFRMKEVALAAGWNRCKDLMTKVADHYKTGDWNDRQVEVEDLAMETWQERKLEGEAA